MFAHYAVGAPCEKGTVTNPKGYRFGLLRHAQDHRSGMLLSIIPSC